MTNYAWQISKNAISICASQIIAEKEVAIVLQAGALHEYRCMQVGAEPDADFQSSKRKAATFQNNVHRNGTTSSAHSKLKQRNGATKSLLHSGKMRGRSRQA